MKISVFLKFTLLFAVAVVFAFPSYGQEVTFTKANITVKDGVLTIDESNPAAPGLMFKFGSVVGVNGFGKDDQKFDPETDVLFDPTSPAQAPYTDWSAIPFTKSEIIHDESNVLLGKGDPCRLVGLTKDQIHSGKVDNGKWRLPTREEYKWFIEKYVDPDGDKEHDCWVEKPAPGLLANDGTFFPAAGHRDSCCGVLNYSVGFGPYWSATSASGGWSVLFFSCCIFQDSGLRSNGSSVRCIRQ